MSAIAAPGDSRADSCATLLLDNSFLEALIGDHQSEAISDAIERYREEMWITTVFALEQLSARSDGILGRRLPRQLEKYHIIVALYPTEPQEHAAVLDGMAVAGPASYATIATRRLIRKFGVVGVLGYDSDDDVSRRPITPYDPDLWPRTGTSSGDG